MADTPRYTTRKEVKVGTRLSGTDRTTSVVTEVVTPTSEESVSEFAILSCGHIKFEPATTVETDSGLLVCEKCLVICAKCKAKLKVKTEAYESFTGDYYCKKHKLWAILGFFEKMFLKK